MGPTGHSAAVEHWAPASPRTASIFVGARNGDGTADPSVHCRPESAAVAVAAGMPPHTPPGAATRDDYNLLVERFLLVPFHGGRKESSSQDIDSSFTDLTLNQCRYIVQGD